MLGLATRLLSTARRRSRDWRGGPKTTIVPRRKHENTVDVRNQTTTDQTVNTAIRRRRYRHRYRVHALSLF